MLRLDLIGVLSPCSVPYPGLLLSVLLGGPFVRRVHTKQWTQACGVTCLMDSLSGLVKLISSYNHISWPRYYLHVIPATCFFHHCPTHRMSSNAAAYFRLLFPFSLVNVSFCFLAVELLYTSVSACGSCFTHSTFSSSSSSSSSIRKRLCPVCSP